MSKREVRVLINAKDQASAKFARIEKALGAMVGAIAVRRIGGAVKGMMDYADSIGKVAARIGLGAEEWQKFTFAAERSGSSAAAVEKAFRNMQRVIMDAGRNPAGEAAKSMEALGLSYRAIADLRPEQQFAAIADRLHLVDDATTKSAIAQQLFGKSGAELIPMLGTYQELGDEISRVGGIITNEAVVAAEKFNDQMKTLGQTIKASVINSGLLEWLTDTADKLQHIGDLWDKRSNFGMRQLTRTQSRDPITGEWRWDKIKSDTYLPAPTPADVVAKKEAVQERRAKKAEVQAAVQASIDRTAAAAAEKQRLALAAAAAKEEAARIQAAARSRATVEAATRDPLTAITSRFLSGMGTTVRPAAETAKNTATLAAEAQKHTRLLADIAAAITGESTPTLSAAPGI